jgi:hypothetical protein
MESVMDSTTMIVVAIVAVAAIVALGVAGFIWMRSRRLQAEMRGRFGPEYDRTVAEMGSRRLADERLQRREKRVAAYSIHPLAEADRSRYEQEWHDVQAEFVEDPNAAVDRADKVLTDVMANRGYPMSEFDRRSADLSVDHPSVVQNYRQAHDIVARNRAGKASTEDLRQAMINYKALFSELVSDRVADARLAH